MTVYEEQGFALAEALVATAIAAFLLVAVVEGIQSAVRTDQMTAAYSAVSSEAGSILVGLRSGLPEGGVAEAFPHWQLLETDNEHLPESLKHMRLSHNESGFEIEFVIMR